MPTTDRIVTIAALTFALGVGVGQLGHVLPLAQAQDASASAEAPTSTGEANASEIVAPDTTSIAVCAVPTLVQDLMESDRFLPDREALQEDLSAQFEELVASLEDLQEEIQTADRMAPETQQKISEFQMLQQELQAKQQEFATQLDEFVMGQLKEAYDLVVSSASAIAEDHGFNYVLSSLGEDADEAVNSQQLLAQIQARPMVRFPDGVDITADVRDDLKLD